jgi:hypothetical protein
MSSQSGDTPPRAPFDRRLETEIGGLKDGRAIALEQVEVVGFEGVRIRLRLLGVSHLGHRSSPVVVFAASSGGTVGRL